MTFGENKLGTIIREFGYRKDTVREYIRDSHFFIRLMIQLTFRTTGLLKLNRISRKTQSYYFKSVTALMYSITEINDYPILIIRSSLFPSSSSKQCFIKSSNKWMKQMTQTTACLIA